MNTHLSTKTNHDNHTTKDDIVRARVNNLLKKDVEKILGRLGITVSEAINMYLAQIKLSNGIPFSIKIPNKTTIKVFEETDKNKNITKAKNVKDIFKQAGV